MNNVKLFIFDLMMEIGSFFKNHFYPGRLYGAGVAIMNRAQKVRPDDEAIWELRSE